MKYFSRYGKVKDHHFKCVTSMATSHCVNTGEGTHLYWMSGELWLSLKSRV
jgi:hypothetical protein